MSTNTCRNSCQLWGMTSYGMNEGLPAPKVCGQTALSICRSESSEYQPNLDSCHYVYSRSLGPWHVLGLSLCTLSLPAPLGLLGFCVDTLLEKAKELGWLDPSNSSFLTFSGSSVLPTVHLSFLSNWPTYPIFYSITIFEHLLLARYMIC